MTTPTAAERAISDLKLFNEIRDTIWEWSDEWSENAHNWLVAEVERLSQAIADAEAAARAWRPIESAPKDGTPILLFDPEQGVIRGKRSQKHWQHTGTWINDVSTWVVFPTHWMPLPAPPEARTPGAAGEGK